MRNNSNDIITQNRVFGWIALATVAVLLIPLVAMQFTDDVNWTAGDFIVAGALLFGAGSLFVIAARMAPAYRLVIGAVVALALVWLWVELAVGLFTGWGD